MSKQKKMHLSKSSVHFLKSFCVSNKEMKGDGKKLTRTQNLRKNGYGGLPATALTPTKTDDVRSKF